MPGVPPGLVTALEERHRFERELGCSGMATVYLARELQHGSLVAVKMLRLDLVPVHGAERFNSRNSGRLLPPASQTSLSVLDSGHADGLSFYVIPCVEGNR